MSTKTTFKRVALVAVAALGLGVLSVAPSSAAPSATYKTMADTTNGQQIIGGQATVFITLDTGTITNIVVTGGTVVSATESETAQAQLGTQTTGSWSESTTASALNFGTSVVLTRADAGTTTITMTPLSASGVPGTAVTKTVSWVAATSVGTYDHSTAFIQAQDTTDRLYADSTTAELTLASTLDANEDASIQITQFNAFDTVTATTLTTAGTKAVTVTITGAGAVGTAPGNAGPSVTIAAASAPAQTVYVYADGRNGAATISIIVNGVVIGTKTVNFYGAVKGYTASTVAAEALNKKYVGIDDTATVTIKGLDSVNTVMPSGAFYVTSETSTIATASDAGSSVVLITGKALGKTTVTVHNAATLATSTFSYDIEIEVTEKTAASYKVAFDAASYAPGAKVTWTVTATTKTGRPIADGARAVLETSTVNMSAPAGIPSGTLTFVNGVATGSFFAPATSGDFVITTVEGNASDVYIAGIAASAAYERATVPNTITITSSGDAAIDAAQEATDAANAATDAALQAADDAAAASKAVAKLSKSVNKALTALKKQITALTALVNKLLK